jgi:hypothetical protein
MPRAERVIEKEVHHVVFSEQLRDRWQFVGANLFAGGVDLVLPLRLPELVAFPDNLAAVKLSHQNLMEQSVLNARVNICCMFNAKLITAIDYCLELSVLEDVEYCLQLLSKGRQTLRFLNYAFQVPASKSNPGGCSEAWKKESRTKSNGLMIERWGDWLRPWNDHSKNVEVKWTSIQAAIRNRL